MYLFATCLLGVLVPVYADNSGTAVPVGNRYRLVEGSTLLDECTICGRPPINLPIDGSFFLERQGPDPLYANYTIRDLKFSSTGGDNTYSGQLNGTYRTGGEVAIAQQMTLTGWIEKIDPIEMDSGFVAITESLPWIVIDVKQVNPDPYAQPYQRYDLHLVAVPWPQVWFSTEVPFTSARKELGKVSAGDLLNSDGRIIHRNHELTERLGIMPMVPDLGLDAVGRMASESGVQPDCLRCETWFSLEEDMFSETLGQLHHGDILSQAGYVVRRYTDLIGSFSPMPPIPDLGLDAFAHQIIDDKPTRLLFSTEEDFFSESLGVKISHGDLLTEDGTIFRTNKQLLSRFHWVGETVGGLGLDAVFVWPYGEIWFSTEDSFDDLVLGHVGHGDLLNDRGRIVMRNLDLMRFFAPMEKLDDFGLDALHVARVIPAGDIDGDCDVDFLDLAAMAKMWLTEDCLLCEGADLTGNQRVDSEDLTILAADWMTFPCNEPILEATWGPCDGLDDGSQEQPRFSVQVEGSYIRFIDRATANCCAERMELQMRIEGSEITLYEVEHPGAPCDCICDYPVTAILGPLEAGTYTLGVWQKNEFGDLFLGAVEVVIGPSMRYQVVPCDEAGGNMPALDEQRFSVSVEGRFIRFQDMIRANCCADNITLDMVVEETTIVVREREWLTSPCFCICDYPTTAIMGPFEPGEYTLEVWQDDEYIGCGKVTIGR